MDVPILKQGPYLIATVQSALSDADLHAACDLLASGCPPELAERILV